MTNSVTFFCFLFFVSFWIFFCLGLLVYFSKWKKKTVLQMLRNVKNNYFITALWKKYDSFTYKSERKKNILWLYESIIYLDCWLQVLELISLYTWNHRPLSILMCKEPPFGLWKLILLESNYFLTLFFYTYTNIPIDTFLKLDFHSHFPKSFKGKRNIKSVNSLNRLW